MWGRERVWVRENCTSLSRALGHSALDCWSRCLPPLQVAVCTPGRMIDLIKMKACSLRRTTSLVRAALLHMRTHPLGGSVGRASACGRC